VLGLPVGVALEIELKVLIVETWICAFISAKMFWIESVHLTELDRLRVHRFVEGEAVTNMIVRFADQLSIVVRFGEEAFSLLYLNNYILLFSEPFYMLKLFYLTISQKLSI
jgi:hypothetical protein